MKKFTTFIILIAITLNLVACGKDSSNDSDAILDHQESEQIADIGKSLSETASESIETVETVIVSLPDYTGTTNVVNSVSLSKNTYPIYVSCLYNQSFFALKPETVETRNNCVDNPYILPYEGFNRDVNLFISCANVTNVYTVDKNFKRANCLSTNTVNGIVYVYYYMDNSGNGGDYYFEIVTDTGVSYYVGIRY